MIALGDVSVTGKEIAVTHTRYVYVEANREGEFASPSLAGVLPLATGREIAVFEGRDRSALRHGAGRCLAAGLNAPSLQQESQET